MSHYSCPECSGPTSVIETRRFNGIIRRRRKCENTHRFSTLEIHFDALPKIRQLMLWLTKQKLDPEIASYAEDRITTIMQGIEEDA